MNIRDIIDKERWAEVGPLDHFHNKSLDRIKAAVNERIAELEDALLKIGGHPTIESPQKITDIIMKAIGYVERL